MINERLLLEQLSNGDRDAYAEVYNHYLPRLYYFVLGFSKSKEDAEEIVQEVFLDIWQRRNSLTSIQSFEPYMFAMARHLIFNMLRRKEHLSRIVGKLAMQEKEDYNTVHENMVFKEYHNAAIEAINKLPGHRKNIFTLRFQKGLKMKEIATEVNLSVSGVKKQLYEAIYFIKEHVRKNSDWTLLFFWLLLH